MTINHPSSETTDTNRQYEKIVDGCREIFVNKAKDYGASWMVLRPISIIDQILIKVKRIRSLQEKKKNLVGESVIDEFKGIINYSIIAMIKFTNTGNFGMNGVTAEKVDMLYKEKIENAKKTMMAKNHDYGEAWRDMRQESFIDLIYMKMLRVEQIVQNDFKTTVSEGCDANFTDIINYAVFALILIQEGKHKG